MNVKLMMMAVLWLLAGVASANDGVFYVNGNQLVPIHETDVAVTKEVLTISIGDDHYAYVDVLYEFTNRGAAKMVDMGFEAVAPYNAEESALGAEGHPYIENFTVTLNGQPLSFKTSLVQTGSEDESTDFKPLNMQEWRKPNPDSMDEEDWGDNLINKKTKESINYSVAYLFRANFKAGKNEVHHTYRYLMSGGVYRHFEIPYWLKPAMRWANHQIDDFTLRIQAKNTAKQFCLHDSGLWDGATWTVTQGKGKVHRYTGGYDDAQYFEFSLRNGTVEWHKKNFRPTDNFTIMSGDAILFYPEEKFKLGRFYDRTAVMLHPYVWDDTTNQEKEVNTDGLGIHRIMRNLPYANRGYVFKDQKLQAYFNSLWWYMPDPTWKQDTSDFTEQEWERVNGK
ncbi:MAG: YARHG domain-containing protein [Bacteroidaceae bacterium]|nr:YARHG domain-containing protein [Bacteroidaceae bacterium]